MEQNPILNPSRTTLELSEALSQLREREEDEDICSFCGKRQSEVEVLVPGRNAVFICNICVSHAAKLIAPNT